MRLSNMVISAVCAAMFGLSGCGSDSNADTSTAGSAAEVSTSEQVAVLKPEVFASSAMYSNFELVACTLSDGSESSCYQVSFRNQPNAIGDLCPKTEEEVGGVGFYNGATASGLFALNAELWAIFAADGYDIIDEDGNVNVVVPTGGPGQGGPGMPPPDSSDSTALKGSCLEAVLEEDMILSYTIPAYPVRLQEVRQSAQFEFPGISIDGFPIAEAPPSTIMGDQAAVPALDSCGGHPQPAGPFHWHIVPQEANNVLAANDVYEVQCNNITQTSSSLIGYANDGFPIYGSQESDGSVAETLDECRGHEGTTDDYADGVYHYHISGTEAPNTLTCFAGATVTSSEFLEYQ
jgi:hypothetical protein